MVFEYPVPWHVAHVTPNFCGALLVMWKTCFPLEGGIAWHVPQVAGVVVTAARDVTINCRLATDSEDNDAIAGTAAVPVAGTVPIAAWILARVAPPLAEVANGP